MSNFQPGWVDELAKAKARKEPTQVQVIDTDPPLWEYLRRSGKKPFSPTQDQFAKARKRGGAKGAKSKAATVKLKKLDAKEQ